MVRVLWLVALAACEARLGGNRLGPVNDANGDATVEPDTLEPDAKIPFGPWSAPTPVDITPATDDDPSLTGDQLELYFNRANDIFVTKRAQVTDPWGPITLVSELSVASITETTPEVTYDGLTIFLASNRAPLTGVLDIYVATRASRAQPFGTPTKVNELTTVEREAATASGDGLIMVFESNRNGNNDTFIAERPTAAVAFGTPAPVTAVNTASSDGNPMLSADGLELFINSDRTTDNELYVSVRASTSDAFPAPTPIAELNDPAADDQDPWISPDGRTLYFTSNRDGAIRLWQSTR
jgi:Tol biopolymer transport system component